MGLFGWIYVTPLLLHLRNHMYKGNKGKQTRSDKQIGFLGHQRVPVSLEEYLPVRLYVVANRIRTGTVIKFSQF